MNWRGRRSTGYRLRSAHGVLHNDSLEGLADGADANGGDAEKLEARRGGNARLLRCRRKQE